MLKRRDGLDRYDQLTIVYDEQGKEIERGWSHSEVPWFQEIRYSSLGSGYMNDCDHSECTYQARPYNGTFVFPLGAVRETITNYVPDGFPILPVPVFLPVGFLGRAYSALFPKLDNDTNLVNFLLELTDFTRMFSSVLTSLRLLAKGKGLNAGAEGLLNYSFGIAPFLSDLTNLHNSYSSFRDKLAKLNDQAGKPLVHHYQEVEDFPLVDTTTAYATWKLRTELMPYSVKRICTIRYSYTLKAGPMPPTWGNYLKSLGIRPSLKTVWDAIPFSFVVDWLVNVGDWLASFDEKLPIELTMVSACASCKYEQTMIYHRLPGQDGYRWSNAWSNWMTYRVKKYRRELISTDLIMRAPNLPKLDNLDIRELVLGSSLLIRKWGPKH